QRRRSPPSGRRRFPAPVRGGVDTSVPHLRRNRMTAMFTALRSTRARRTSALVASGLAVALLAAGCSRDGGDDTPDKVTPPKIAFTTSFVGTSYLPSRYGPMPYGPELGMDYTKDDLMVFGDNTTAMQSLLGGSAQVIAGSFPGTALLISQG